MKPVHLALVLGVAAAMTCVSAQASDHRKAARSRHKADFAMKVVPVHPKKGQPGHGWRYFADARDTRAVVISPGGEYYYSEGGGLELVYKPTRAA